MKKRIGNDITFTWHIYRKDGDTQVPESFDGKDVEVKLISPLRQPVTIEDVTIATGVVTFTFRGKHQVTLGNYVAVLQENKGEDGMVTIDVVSAVTLVPHSYMEEDGDEGDVIEASSVELESSIIAGGIVQQQADWAQTDDTAVDFIKNKPDLDLYVPKMDDNGHGNMSIYSPGNIVLTLADEQGVVNQTGSFRAGGWSVSSPDGKFQTFGNSIYRGTMGFDHDSVVWEKTATQQIPAATTEENGLMSAADKSKLNDLPTATELAQELGGKANSADLAEVATSGNYNDLSNKPDLSGFITNSVDNLVNYYLKSETYTKTEVQQLIGAIQQFHYEVYATLPQTGASNVLYLIGPTGTGTDKYEEYVYANNDWAKIGDTSIDLSGYVTTQALNTALADYVTSSALSVLLSNYVNKDEIDDVPTAGSKNLVESGGVYSTTPSIGNNSAGSDLDFSDEDGNVVMRLSGGHIKTKYFDSRLSSSNGSTCLYHIILLGQSLSMGYDAKPCLDKVETSKAFMFKQVRTMDFGYIFGITKATYNANQENYDNLFYSDVKGLIETGGNGTKSSRWEDASYNEWETPCSGIVEGLLNCYKECGFTDIPFYTICTASGIGGTPITSFDEDSDKIINRTHRDIINAYNFALSRGLTYKPVFIWVQGENNASFTKDYIKTALDTVYTNLTNFLKNKGFVKSNYVTPFISYQTEYNPGGYYTSHSTANQNNALAQFEMNQEKEWFYLSYPIYNLDLAPDKVHLTNLSSRKLGNSLGVTLFHVLNGNFNTLKITEAQLDGNTVILKFNREIISDYNHLSRVGYTSEMNQLIQNHYGFFAFDENNNEITINNISIENDMYVKIVCSSVPSEIRYGYKQQADNYTLGGTIREKKVYKSYKNTDMYLYAPIQYIKEFTNKFNY